MKTTTFDKRTSAINRNTKGYQLAKELLTYGGTIRPCWTSGTGRFCKNMDYTNDTIDVLKHAGLKEGKDFVCGNDAPKGGKTGNFIRLIAKSKRIK